MKVASDRDGVHLFAFTIGWMTLPLSFFLEGEEGRIRVPATAFLIDHPDGLAMFDTGLGPRFARPAGIPASNDIDLEDDALIDARLHAIGVDPDDVRWIISSHLHLDHAGGNCLLPNATVIVQASEHEHAFSSGDRAYHRPEFDTGQRFKRIQGEYDVFGDAAVVLFPTPGHTPGHQSARIRTTTGEVILASDCCNLKRSLDDLHLPDHCHDADRYLQTLKGLSALRAQGSRIFYAHDPEFWAGVPQGVPLD